MVRFKKMFHAVLTYLDFFLFVGYTKMMISRKNLKRQMRKLGVFHY